MRTLCLVEEMEGREVRQATHGRRLGADTESAERAPGRDKDNGCEVSPLGNLPDGLVS